MIDLRRLRAEPDVVRAQLARRHIDLAPFDRVRALDADQRKVAQRRDELRARRNELSQEVGRRRRDGDVAGAEQLSAESRALSDDERELAIEADRLSADIRAELLVLPNLPAPECPDGRDEQDNV